MWESITDFDVLITYLENVIVTTYVYIYIYIYAQNSSIHEMLHNDARSLLRQANMADMGLIHRCPQSNEETMFYVHEIL